MVTIKVVCAELILYSCKMATIATRPRFRDARYRTSVQKLRRPKFWERGELKWPNRKQPLATVDCIPYFIKAANVMLGWILATIQHVCVSHYFFSFAFIF